MGAMRRCVFLLSSLRHVLESLELCADAFLGVVVGTCRDEVQPRGGAYRVQRHGLFLKDAFPYIAYSCATALVQWTFALRTIISIHTYTARTLRDCIGLRRAYVVSLSVFVM